MITRLYADVEAEVFDFANARLNEAGEQLQTMGSRIIHPCDRGDAPSHYAALLSCPGTIIDHPWQLKFWGDLNAFLNSAHGVPNVIQYHLGYDYPAKNAWLNTLDPLEQDRRKRFQKNFEKKCKPFRDNPLSGQRAEGEHRSGRVRAEVRVRGFYGKEYVGTRDEHIPVADTQFMADSDDPSAHLAAADSFAIPLRVSPRDFWFVIPQQGNPDMRLPLFEECKRYLGQAAALIAEARALASATHGGYTITLL
jgi:hypothetical protein